MTKRILSAVAIASLTIIASCNFGKGKNSFAHFADSIAKADSVKNNAPPVNITYRQMFDKENQDKRVTVEGYLALPSTSYKNDATEQVDFYERKGMFWSSESITLNVMVGKKMNGMDELPDKYHADDLKVYDKTGKQLGVGSRVRITGKLSTYGTLDADDIEAVEDTPVDYTKLDVTNIDASHPADTTLEGKLVSAEGTIEIPMSTLDGNYTWLYLHIKGIEEGQIIHIRYGNKSNQIESLPDNYTEDDVKIHDRDGNIVGKKKVRVYGVYDNDAIKVENIQVQ